MLPTMTVEVGFAANPTVPLASTTWTDITGHVRSISIRRGRSSELDDYTAGTAMLALDNSDRRFDPSYTQVNYLNLPGGTGDNATTPDHASLDPTAALDVRWSGRLADWSSTLQRFLDHGAANTGYEFRINNVGNLVLELGDGAAFTSAPSSAPVPFGDNADGAVRATWRATDGRVQFFTSTDEGVTWVQLGTDETIAIASIAASSEILAIGTTTTGAGPATGRCYWAQVRSSIDGTIVANPDFRTIYSGPTSITDSTGKIWTVGGAATIADLSYHPNVLPMRRIRIRATHNAVTHDLFAGFIEGWPQEYEPPKYAEVSLRCVDAFEVLRNLDLPDSVWAIEVAADVPAPSAWFRFGETRGLAVANSASSTAQSTRGEWTDVASAPSGTSLLPYSSDPSARFDGTAFVRYFKTFVGLTDQVINTTNQAEFWLRCTTEAGAWEIIFVEEVFRSQLGIRTAIAIRGGGEGQLYAIRDNTSIIMDDGPPITDGKVHHVRVKFGSLGGIWIDGVEQHSTGPLIIWSARSSGLFHIGASNDQLSRFKGELDELVLYTSTSTINDHSPFGFAPWDGDTSGTRIGRILDVIDWPIADRDIDGGQSILGPEALDTDVLTALKRVATAEDGRFFVGRGGKIVFRGRHHNLAAPIVTATWSDGGGSDFPYSAVGFGFNFNRDQVANVAIGSRSGGTTLTHEDAASIAEFTRREISIGDLPIRTDSELRNRLEYLVHRHKDPLLRVDAVRIHPAREATGGWSADDLWQAVLGLELAQRHVVKRHPQTVGGQIAATVLLEGIEHRVGTGQVGAVQDWATTMYLSPADVGPYWVLGTSELGITTGLGY